VLGIFLLGIAFGALCAKKVCEMKKNYTMIFIASMLAFSSIAYYLSIPFIGLLLTVSKQFGMCAAYLSVGILSFLVGGIFPVLCHYGVRSSNAVGLSVSWIYFANILGSTTGPLLTGFVLMNAFPLQQNILYLSVATLALSALVWLAAPIANPLKAAMGGAVAMGIVGMLIFHAGLYSQILEKLHFQTHFAKDSAYKYVIQNRSGIIAVEAGKNDTLYGGGVYDGRFNINPVLDSNGITRAYMVAALHPQPEEVLDIGLGSGSWARVIANHAGVKSLTVVEINPGYLKAIKNYPEIATILNDPKIDIHTDDGRRWLNRNPDRKFDFIVMNTTMHWRDGATNLLSEEFLRLCKQHLKAGGVIYYNATASKDVPFTASQVFRHVTMVGSFVAASDSPFALSEKEKRQNLLKFLDSGRPLFTENSNLQRVLTNLARNDISDKADVIRANERLWHITDDNMATEFKATNRWFKARATWVNLLKRLMAMKSLFSISESY
jgi:spermidine synthase